MVIELLRGLSLRRAGKTDFRKRLHECLRETAVSSSIANAPSKRP